MNKSAPSAVSQYALYNKYVPLQTTVQESKWSKNQCMYPVQPRAETVIQYLTPQNEGVIRFYECQKVCENYLTQQKGMSRLNA